MNELYYCEESVKEVTISAGETAEVTFLNIVIPKGHLTVAKSTDTDTDIMGWKFALYYDEACTQLAYGPVATDPFGLALFEDIKVGTYWVKEIGHTNAELGSYYTCTSRNPQPITIIPDDTVNAYFYNRMNTGAIVIHKTDPYQNSIAGAHFLLEWSASGSIWTPVEYSPTPGWGKCTSPGLKDGILITDSSGYISFQGLAVGVYYRISEVKAPNGFQLLGDYAYEGMLTSNGEVITLNVVNTPVFTLPHTGSRSMIGISAGLAVCLLTCAGAIYYLKRKEK
ncbi:MAG: LPXTG cell wall anchor domain-containing protein [Oscillospiraceae bacterium]|nr:LPXTG cell wall anchor domain-containing protein [Oscillospiraceae bacterium]